MSGGLGSGPLVGTFSADLESSDVTSSAPFVTTTLPLLTMTIRLS